MFKLFVVFFCWLYRCDVFCILWFLGLFVLSWFFLWFLGEGDWGILGILVKLKLWNLVCLGLIIVGVWVGCLCCVLFLSLLLIVEVEVLIEV